MGFRTYEEEQSDELLDEIRDLIKKACGKTAQFLAQDEWYYTKEYLDEVEEAFDLLRRVRKLLN